VYEVHKLTGSMLIDGDGRVTGPESAGAVSRHRTREAAERERDRQNKTGMGARYEVRPARKPE
jgi:hypothetical protein